MLSIESGWLDSNQRPRAPQTCTLTGLSYIPNCGCKGMLYFWNNKCFSAFSLTPHGFPVKIEHLEYLFLGGRLVDAYIAYFTHQCEVDNARSIFLVVGHEFIQAIVLLAVECHDSIMFLDELDGLPEFVFGESYLEVRMVKLAHHSPGNGISMKYRTMGFQCQALECMAYGMS